MWQGSLHKPPMRAVGCGPMLTHGCTQTRARIHSYVRTSTHAPTYKHRHAHRHACTHAPPLTHTHMHVHRHTSTSGYKQALAHRCCPATPLRPNWGQLAGPYHKPSVVVLCYTLGSSPIPAQPVPVLAEPLPVTVWPEFPPVVIVAGSLMPWPSRKPPLFFFLFSWNGVCFLFFFFWGEEKRFIGQGHAKTNPDQPSVPPCFIVAEHPRCAFGVPAGYPSYHLGRMPL
jgi:hypothetical protein